MPYKLFVVISTLILSFSVNAKGVDWIDYNEARALNSDKPIFVFAKMRFCGACNEMEASTFSDPAVIALLNEHFIPVKETINSGFSRFVFDDLKDENGKTLKFRGFPSIMLVEGKKYSISQGFKTAEQLMAVLKVN